MHATVFPDRIDIFGSGLTKDLWIRLLDELKAEDVPGRTQTGKRMAAAGSPSGPVAFIYRTTPMSNEEVIRILGKYGIQTAVATQ
ncbi:MAG: hypothetical protein WBL70_19085 [Candidatus Acidiferrales bacterium]